MAISNIWTMARYEDGLEMTLAQWGVTKAVRKSKSMGAGTMDLGFQGAAIDASVPVNIGDNMLVKRSGVNYFCGRVFAPAKSGSGSSESYQIQLRDAWSYMDGFIYMQEQRFLLPGPLHPPSTPGGTADAIAANLQDPSLWVQALEFSPIVVIGNDPSSLAWVNTYAAAYLAMSFASSGGGGNMGNFILGSGWTGVQLPREELRSVTCSEVVRRMAALSPDVVSSMDFSTVDFNALNGFTGPDFTPAKLNFLVREAMPTRTLTIDTAGSSNIEGIESITPRFDLVTPGVFVYWINSVTSGNIVLRQLTTDFAGISDGERAMHLVFDLDGISVDSAGVITYGDPVPSGVASQIYLPYSQLFYDGSLTIHQEECPQEDWLSKTINIVGGDPKWASMNALVVSSSDSLHSGVTTLTLGAPTQLSPNDIAARLRVARNRTPVGSAQNAGNNGGGGPTASIQPNKDSSGTAGPGEDTTGKDGQFHDSTPIGSVHADSIFTGHAFRGTYQSYVPPGVTPTGGFPPIPAADTPAGTYGGSIYTEVHGYADNGTPNGYFTVDITQVKFSVDFAGFSLKTTRKLELILGYVSTLLGGAVVPSGQVVSFVSGAIGKTVNNQVLPPPPCVQGGFGWSQSAGGDVNRGELVNRTVIISIRAWDYPPPK